MSLRKLKCELLATLCCAGMCCNSFLSPAEGRSGVGGKKRQSLSGENPGTYSRGFSQVGGVERQVVEETDVWKDEEEQRVHVE